MDRIFNRAIKNLIYKISVKTKQINLLKFIYKSNILLIESGIEYDYYSKKFF